MNIAERIKSCRKLKGLTQVKLAEILYISPMTIRRWEWGERTPNAELIPKLAEVLDVSVDYLTGLNDEKNVMKRLLENISSPETFREIKETSQKSPSCFEMDYWSDVVDSALAVAFSRDERKNKEVFRMLTLALSTLIKMADFLNISVLDNSNVSKNEKSSNIDIHNNKIRDATFSFAGTE